MLRNYEAVTPTATGPIWWHPVYPHFLTSPHRTASVWPGHSVFTIIVLLEGFLRSAGRLATTILSAINKESLTLDRFDITGSFLLNGAAIEEQIPAYYPA